MIGNTPFGLSLSKPSPPFGLSLSKPSPPFGLSLSKPSPPFGLSLSKPGGALAFPLEAPRQQRSVRAAPAALQQLPWVSLGCAVRALCGAPSSAALRGARAARFVDW